MKIIQIIYFFKRLFLILLLVLGMVPNFSLADDNSLPILKVLSSHVDTDSSLNEEGKIIAKDIDNVRRFLDAKGVKYELTKMPWARILREIETTNNSLVVSLVRTQRREKNYIWFLKLSTFTDHLIGRDLPEFKSLSKQQILSGNYKAICGKETVQCDSLEDYGFPKDRIIKTTATSTLNLGILILRGRADFMITSLTEFEKLLRFKKLNANQLVPISKIDTRSNYLAASKSLDPRYIKILMNDRKEVKSSH